MFVNVCLFVIGPIFLYIPLFVRLFGLGQLQSLHLDCSDTLVWLGWWEIMMSNEKRMRLIYYFYLHL